MILHTQKKDNFREDYLVLVIPSFFKEKQKKNKRTSLFHQPLPFYGKILNPLFWENFENSIPLYKERGVFQSGESFRVGRSAK